MDLSNALPCHHHYHQFELPHEEHDDHEHDRRELKTFKAKTTKAQAAQAKAVKAKAVKTKAVKAKGDKAKDKKAKPKAKAAPVKAAQGGEEEHEHMPFIYRNGIIKPRVRKSSWWRRCVVLLEVCSCSFGRSQVRPLTSVRPTRPNDPIHRHSSSPR